MSWYLGLNTTLSWWKEDLPKFFRFKNEKFTNLHCNVNCCAIPHNHDNCNHTNILFPFCIWDTNFRLAFTSLSSLHDRNFGSIFERRTKHWLVRWACVSCKWLHYLYLIYKFYFKPYIYVMFRNKIIRVKNVCLN